MVIANVADLLRQNSNAHSCLQRNMYKNIASVNERENLFLFYSIWQYQFSFQTCFHQVRVPPPHLPPPDPCIYLYCYTTLSCSVLSHCELGGGGRGRARHGNQGSYIYQDYWLSSQYNEILINNSRTEGHAQLQLHFCIKFKINTYVCNVCVHTHTHTGMLIQIVLEKETLYSE